MTLDSLLFEITKLDHIDQQSLSAFLIDLVHTQEQFKRDFEEFELRELAKREVVSTPIEGF